MNFEWALLIITSRARSPTGIRIYQPFVPVRVYANYPPNGNVKMFDHGIITSLTISPNRKHIIIVFTDPFHLSSVDKEHQKHEIYIWIQTYG